MTVGVLQSIVEPDHSIHKSRWQVLASLQNLINLCSCAFCSGSVQVRARLVKSNGIERLNNLVIKSAINRLIPIS